MDTVPNRTPFKGYRWLKLTVHDPYKEIRVFKSSSSTLTDSEISVEITDRSLFYLDCWNYERSVIKKWIMKINAVNLVYVESCYKSSTSKYDKSKMNINISTISHLPFDVLFFSLGKITTLCQMHQPSTSLLKGMVVQNCVNDMTIS